MRKNTWRVLFLTGLSLALGGCSTLARDPPRPVLPAGLAGAGAGLTVLVAPVVLDGAVPPADPVEAERVGLRRDAAGLAEELARALAPVVDGAWAAGADVGRERVLELARERGARLVLWPRLRRFDAFRVGTNGWFVPNAGFIYWYLWFPSFVIADEVYGVDVELEYTLSGLENNRPLPGFERRAVRASSSDDVLFAGGLVPRVELDDLDRGIALLAGTYRRLDREQWDRIASQLEVYGTRALGGAVARDLGRELAQGEWSRLAPAARGRVLAAVHAVVVGVDRAPAQDECRFASDDARQFAGAIDRGGETVASTNTAGVALHRNVALLPNEAATVANVRSALAAVARVARPEDTVVFYFAGRGVALAGEGTAGLGLALAGAPPDDVARGVPRTVLGLKELAVALGNVPARRKLVVIDAGFGGGPRSVGPAPETPADRRALGEALERTFLGDGQRGAIVLAAPPGDVAHVLDAAKGGLLTAALALILAEGGGSATLAELDRQLQERVGALADLELEGQQRPLVVTNEPAVSLFER